MINGPEESQKETPSSALASSCLAPRLGRAAKQAKLARAHARVPSQAQDLGVTSRYIGLGGMLPSDFRTAQWVATIRALQHEIEGFDRGFDYQNITEPKSITEVKDYVKNALPEMGKAKIEELRATIGQYYLSRFTRNRGTPKYGKLNKGFDEKQIQAFFRVIDNPKMKLLFTFQAELGLRIGEVVKVNIKNINLETREMILRTEKTKILDTLLIPLPLFREMLEFIKENSKKIESSGGYIFFNEVKFTKRDERYLEPNYARNKFREYTELAGLTETYDISEEKNGRKPRSLHRLTTHSLRHYAITRFARNSNGNLLLTSKFARHVDPQTTSTYVNLDKKEVYQVIESIAVSEVELLKRKLSR